MILDTMSKREVMQSLRNDFDQEVLPYYNSIRLKLQSLLKARSEREKKPINLGWEPYVTKNKTIFHILKKGDKDGDTPQFTSEFKWRGKQCYSTLFNEGIIVVYQKHCLERYAERVLQKNIDPKDIMYKYLLKKQESAYSIVLPTPTHKYCWYLVMADALFLGDVDAPSSEADKKFAGKWFNTCISLEKTRYTQEGIMQTLQFMQDFVKTLRYDPIKEKTRFEGEKRSIFKDEIKKENLKVFFEKAYMMYMLHLSFNFLFTKELFMDEINETMEYIKDTLQKDFSISVASLSPFGKEKGIALKGEIDFRG